MKIFDFKKVEGIEENSSYILKIVAESKEDAKVYLANHKGFNFSEWKLINDGNYFVNTKTQAHIMNINNY